MKDPRVSGFLESAGWSGASRTPLAGDASSRRYERLEDHLKSAILMVDPSVDTVRQFVHVTRILAEYGYSAPAILAEDIENGLLLLEDLGDRLFARLIEQGTDEEVLYKLAVDFLIDLGTQTLPTGLPFFSPSYVLDQNAMFLDWYIPAKTGSGVAKNARNFYQQIWRELLGLIEAEPEGILLRDFHAENILQLEEREGLAALGLLDYQDAMTGPAAYDLVSLFQDARRDVSAVLEEKMIRYYLEKTGKAEKEFRLSYAVLGAHRALRIMGIFTKLAQADGKPRYMEFMPRMQIYLKRNLAHPELIALQHWLEITLGEIE